ncbi:hypothetical protein [Prevotella sp. KH2C16]|uniref:hypothetical protein n=1 Tax=Prevotella sp. KH2C16 TaxID=1855325 RepID=UPI000B85A522|nr:hypothetical protein [Prevotella sp. KH2C16]
MKELKEELTAKMHSEFTVSKETEIKHKAGSMWSVAGFDCDGTTMKEWCGFYGITPQQALKYKDYWRKLSEK